MEAITVTLDPEAIAAVRHDLVIGVRAGETHRFTPVWAVVVNDSVFVRSWGLSGQGWYDEFLVDPDGAAEIGGRQFEIRARREHREDVLCAVDEAYCAKYHTRGSLKYVEDLNSSPRRETTVELVPSPSPRT